VRDGTVPPSEQEVRKELERICKRLRSKVVGKFTDSYQQRNRGVMASTARGRAQKHVVTREKADGAFATAGGKDDILPRLFDWSQANFTVSLSAHAIAGELKPDEVPGELRSFLTAFHDVEPLDVASAETAA
jgi:hypothetical protein